MSSDAKRVARAKRTPRKSEIVSGDDAESMTKKVLKEVTEEDTGTLSPVKESETSTTSSKPSRVKRAPRKTLASQLFNDTDEVAKKIIQDKIEEEPEQEIKDKITKEETKEVFTKDDVKKNQEETLFTKRLMLENEKLSKELRDAKLDFEAKLKILKEEKDELISKSESISQQLKESEDGRISLMEASQKDSQKMSQNFQNASLESKKKLQEMSDRIVGLEAKLKDSVEEKSSLILKHNEEIQTVSNELLAETQRSKQLEAELLAATQYKEDVKDKNSLIKGDYEKILKEKDEKVKRMEAELKSLKTANSEMRGTEEEKKTIIDKLQIELESIKGKYEALAADLDNQRESSQESFEEEKLKYKNEIEKAKKECVEIKNENEKKSHIIASITSEKDAANIEIQRLKSELEIAQAQENEQIENNTKADDLNATIVQLQSSKEAWEAEKKELHKQIKDTNELKEGISNSLNILNETRELENRLISETVKFQNHGNDIQTSVNALLAKLINLRRESQTYSTFSALIFGKDQPTENLEQKTKKLMEKCASCLDENDFNYSSLEEYLNKLLGLIEIQKRTQEEQNNYLTYRNECENKLTELLQIEARDIYDWLFAIVANSNLSPEKSSVNDLILVEAKKYNNEINQITTIKQEKESALLEKDALSAEILVLKNQTKAIDELKSDIYNLKWQLDASQSENNKLKDSNEQLMAEIQQNLRMYNEKEASIREYHQKTIIKLEETLKSNENSFNEWKESADAAKAAYEDKIQELTSTCVLLQTQIDNWKQSSVSEERMETDSAIQRQYLDLVQEKKSLMENNQLLIEENKQLLSQIIQQASSMVAAPVAVSQKPSDFNNEIDVLRLEFKEVLSKMAIEYKEMIKRESREKLRWKFLAESMKTKYSVRVSEPAENPLPVAKNPLKSSKKQRK